MKKKEFWANAQNFSQGDFHVLIWSKQVEHSLMGGLGNPSFIKINHLFLH